MASDLGSIPSVALNPHHINLGKDMRPVAGYVLLIIAACIITVFCGVADLVMRLDEQPNGVRAWVAAWFLAAYVVAFILARRF